jgi:hypothetical protein
VSDARRQLVLRTFASTGGNADRTAKLVGVSVEEVRSDLMALVNREGGDDEDADGAGPRLVDPSPAARPAGTAKKSPPNKKR